MSRGRQGIIKIIYPKEERKKQQQKKKDKKEEKLHRTGRPKNLYLRGTWAAQLVKPLS